MENLDFLGIGDITTDNFIKLKNAEVTCEVDHTNCKISMPFGEKVPFEDSVLVSAVGNASNASVSASRLGLKSGLLSFVGDDEWGKKNIETLREEGVSTSLMEIQIGKKSNYHFVLLFGAERTILIKHEDYAYTLPEMPTIKWIYLSSFGEKALDFHSSIADYLKANPKTKLAFQPGTFQINLGVEKIKDIYSLSEIFFCNIEEAEKITNFKELVSDRKEKIRKMAKLISDFGPKIVVLTDGPAGAYVYTPTKFLYIPQYPDPAPPVDRTGAGDSFASAITSALALGLPLEEAIMWGPINSMSVVQYIGAREGLLSKEKIEKYLRERPEHYKITSL